MATIAQRYLEAGSYIRGTLDAARPNIFVRTLGGNSTASVRSELAKLERRWSDAKTDLERAAVARDAELLADRVQENFPGASQDRTRTNLFPGEQQRSTPGPSYLREFADEAQHGWLATKFAQVQEKGGDALNLLLLGGVLVLAIRALDAAAPRNAMNDALNRQLEITADERDDDGIDDDDDDDDDDSDDDDNEGLEAS